MLSLGVYIEKLVFGVYNHQTEVMELEVSTIYTTRDIILNALRHVWPWFSKSKVEVTILIYLFEFRDIDLVLIDTKHTFLRYILPEIYHFECVTSCLTLNVKIKSQGHDIDIIISFWIPRHRFSTYRHQTQVPTMYTTRDIILNALRHVWPCISRSKVKVKILIYIFLNSATLI